jgi:Fe-S cluster assembly protein SufD
MTSPLLTRIATEHAAALAAHAGDPQAQARRRQALQGLLERGLPSGRDENWRYANLRILEKANFAPGDAPGVNASELPAAIEGFTRFVFVDGQFAPQLSGALGEHGAATIGRLTGELPAADQAFALLNAAFATDGADVSVAAAASAAPVDIEVVFFSASGAAAYPRLRVQLARGARLRLIERYAGAAAAAPFINPVVDIEVGAGATLQHYRLQQAGAAATWTDTLRASLAGDASYQLHLLQIGALAARSSVDIALDGAGAQTRIDVVSLADGQQVHDNMIVVDHKAAHTRTEENFRGIAGGRARLAFNGLIRVRDTARNADSAQSLKGLITGNDAEVDLRPQLEIHTDEVRCSHGATTGKLDEGMLFYLLTRGIDRELAQRLLKWAFITDVVAKIDIPALRTHVQRSLASHMQDARSLEELLT